MEGERGGREDGEGGEAIGVGMSSLPLSHMHTHTDTHTDRHTHTHTHTHRWEVAMVKLERLIVTCILLLI